MVYIYQLLLISDDKLNEIEDVSHCRVACVAYDILFNLLQRNCTSIRYAIQWPWKISEEIQLAFCVDYECEFRITYSWCVDVCICVRVCVFIETIHLGPTAHQKHNGTCTTPNIRNGNDTKDVNKQNVCATNTSRTKHKPIVSH